MKKKLKVLLVSSASMNPPYSEVTGIKAVYELQKELAQDVDLHILNLVSARGEKVSQEWLREQKDKHQINFHIVPLSFLANMRFIGAFWAHFRLFLATIRMLRKESFDIIHEYSSMPIFFRKAFFYKLFAKKIRVFHTLVVNNLNFLAHPRYGGGGKNVDLIICPSQLLLRQLSENRYRKGALKRIPFGVRVPEFNRDYDVGALRKHYDIPDSVKIVLYVGLLDKRKGADVFLQSIPKIVQQYPDCVFMFVSSPIHKGVLYKHDQAKQAYSQWMKAAEDNLIFLEGRQNIPALMKMADIFVYPIASMHGILSLPLTLLEAIISKKAIVTSDIYPMKDIFSHNQNAIMIPPNDAQVCSESIVDLLKSPNTVTDLEKNVSHLAEQFDLRHCANDLMSEYKTI